jgi:hypothetical protein
MLNSFAIDAQSVSYMVMIELGQFDYFLIRVIFGQTREISRRSIKHPSITGFQSTGMDISSSVTLPGRLFVIVIIPDHRDLELMKLRVLNYTKHSVDLKQMTIL